MFHGSIVALVTPMDDTGALDDSALAALVEWHLEQGTNAIVISGTTGESPTLSEAELRRLLDVAVRSAAGRLPIIAGTGTACTAKSIKLTREAADAGAAAALVVTPYYNRPMQSGLEAHYLALAEAVELPLVMYNVPKRTGVDMLPATVARLARHERIVGLKEAVADPARVQELLEACPAGFTVLSGDDGSCLAAMQAGAQGVISVAANVAPRHMSRLCAAALAGDWDHARKVDGDLAELFRQLAVESNPIPVKWGVWRMGLIGPGIRLPLLPLDARLRPALEACLAELGLLPGENTN